MSAIALPSFRMTGKGFRALTITQAKLIFRERAVLVWVGLPVVLLIIFGNIHSFQTPQHDLGGRRVIDVYVPTIAGMLPLFLGLVGLPMAMAGLREKEVLPRFSVSPVPAAGLLAALLTVIVGLVTVGVLLIIAVGRLAFDVSAPANLGAVVSSFVLGSTAVLALGLMVAAFARTGPMASGLGVPLMVINFFFSGLLRAGRRDAAHVADDR